MKIQTQQIKEFQQRTSAIKTSNIIPSLAYIMLKVENGIASLIKTNLSIFCKYSFSTDAADTVMMLEEHSLYTFISATKSSEFEISISEKVITLTDGKLTVPFTTIPHEDYPKFPGNKAIKNPVTLSEDVINSLFCASNFLSGTPDNYNYVHTDNGNIFGGHQFGVFIKKGYELPVFSITQDACSLLNQYSEITHYSEGNMDFFNAGNTIYGFVKSEMKCPDYSRILEKSTDGGFTIIKSDIVSFCQTAMALSDEKAPVCSLFMDGDTAKAKYNNKSKGKGNELVIGITGSIETEINFAPDVFLKMKHLPYNKLNISTNCLMCFVTTEEDTNYLGIFSQSIK